MTPLKYTSTWPHEGKPMFQIYDELWIIKQEFNTVVIPPQNLHPYGLPKSICNNNLIPVLSGTRHSHLQWDECCFPTAIKHFNGIASLLDSYILYFILYTKPSKYTHPGLSLLYSLALPLHCIYFLTLPFFYYFDFILLLFIF